jgi:hypothetical protein
MFLLRGKYCATFSLNSAYLPMKLVRLIKMCLNEAYTKFRIGKHLYDALNQGV